MILSILANFLILLLKKPDTKNRAIAQTAAHGIIIVFLFIFIIGGSISCAQMPPDYSGIMLFGIFVGVILTIFPVYRVVGNVKLLKANDFENENKN